jgi:hypothetical protein
VKPLLPTQSGSNPVILESNEQSQLNFIVRRSSLRPNNRLQWMRGLACFRARRVLRGGPAPLTLGALGRWQASRRP